MLIVLIWKPINDIYNPSLITTPHHRHYEGNSPPNIAKANRHSKGWHEKVDRVCPFFSNKKTKSKHIFHEDQGVIWAHLGEGGLDGTNSFSSSSSSTLSFSSWDLRHLTITLILGPKKSNSMALFFSISNSSHKRRDIQLKWLSIGFFLVLLCRVQTLYCRAT